MDPNAGVALFAKNFLAETSGSVLSENLFNIKSTDLFFANNQKNMIDCLNFVKIEGNDFSLVRTNE
jgi:hypothetical protein